MLQLFGVLSSESYLLDAYVCRVSSVVPTLIESSLEESCIAMQTLLGAILENCGATELSR